MDLNNQVPSLAPDHVVGGAIREVRENVPALAQAGDSDKTTLLLGWMRQICESYWEQARDILIFAQNRASEALENLSGSEGVTGQVVQKFRAGLRKILASRATEAEIMRQSLKDAQLELRRLAIGMTGSDNPIIDPPNAALETLIATSVVVGVFTLEYFVNFGVIQYATDSNTSTAFSIVMSLAGALLAYLGATTFNQRAEHGKATEAFKKNFPQGTDPATGKRVEVFPLPGRLPMMFKLSHVGLVIVCMTVLVIRGSVLLQRDRWGEMSGSLAVIIILISYYLYKLWKSIPYDTATLRRYLKAAATVDDLTEKLQSQDASSDDEDLKPVVEEYNQAISRLESKRTESLERLEELVRLSRESALFPQWIAAEAAQLDNQLTGGDLESLPVPGADYPERLVDGELVNKAEALLGNQPPVPRAIEVPATIREVWAEVQAEAVAVTTRRRLLAFRPTGTR